MPGTYDEIILLIVLGLCIFMLAWLVMFVYYIGQMVENAVRNIKIHRRQAKLNAIAHRNMCAFEATNKLKAQNYRVWKEEWDKKWGNKQ